MKTRIISALIGLVVLGFVIYNFDSLLLNLAVAAVVVIAVDEILGVLKIKENRLLSFISYAFGFLVPFVNKDAASVFLPCLCFLYVALSLTVLLRYHSMIKIVDLGFSLGFITVFSLSGFALVNLRDTYGTYAGLYAVIVILAGAWMSDTGAYFAGVFFGKHKMSPNISPKKTVEGAIGGIVTAILAQLLLAYLYVMLLGKLGIEAHINYLLIALLSPAISLVSILGDLSASIIKRQNGIKDFGKIMPGHGGILDRFDSVLMVIPFVYVIFAIKPLITIL